MNLKTSHIRPTTAGIAMIRGLRFGPQIAYEPEGKGGSEAQTPEATPDNANKADEQPKGGEQKTGGEQKADAEKQLSESEARMLKDLMKHKDAAKEAKRLAEEAEKNRQAMQSKIRDILGVENLDELDAKLADMKKAEEEQLKKAGDFDALRERLISEHKKEVERLNGSRNQEVGELKKKLEETEAQVRRLSVSNAFAGSQYIADELTIAGAHAERLYGDHFKVEQHDGRIVPVAYIDGKPLVNAEGKPLAFDDALKEIIAADPLKEKLFKPKAAPGAGSGVEGRNSSIPQADNLRGAARIAAALAGTSK